MVPAREPVSGMLLKNAVEKSLLSSKNKNQMPYQVPSIFYVTFFLVQKQYIFVIGNLESYQVQTK